jgi:hypothetical protein
MFSSTPGSPKQASPSNINSTSVNQRPASPKKYSRSWPDGLLVRLWPAHREYWRQPLIATLMLTPAAAADLSAPAEPLPPPPPSFYVHAGALGVFFQTNAQPTGGGLFPTTNITLRPVYTLALEAGYFVTPISRSRSRRVCHRSCISRQRGSLGRHSMGRTS